MSDKLPSASRSRSDSGSRSGPRDLEFGKGRSAKIASIFGGSGVTVGPRICDIPEYLKEEVSEGEGESSEAILNRQLASEDGAAIKYRTCSWQKTAALLFSEYICLAIMSFPWSYSYLGLVPGLILTVVIAAIVLYTSLVLWEFCLRHPEVRDVCDLGQTLFWGKEWAWWGTAVMFVLNNTFIQALHVLVGAEYLNTMTENTFIGGCRTVEFSVVIVVICWLASLPRTFSMMSRLGTASAFFTLISVVLATAFAGIEGKPAGYSPEKGEPIVTAVPLASTTFVQGMAAFLNISYTFIGQITLPSFIAEMRDPREFPKSLWACTIAEIIVFSVVGGVIYAYTGNQYMTAPAFGSLDNLYKKVSFSFMIPTIIFLGCLYASVTSRFVFFRLFRNSKHLSDHTVVGWGSWAGILLTTWIFAFIISQVIPFFSSLLSVMSSLFDSWFGFIFWGVAYFRMRSADKTIGRQRNVIGDWLSMGLNVLIILTGFFFLTAGTYASVQGIIDSFEAGEVGGAFSCKSNGL
ncbi:Amino acid transporter, transmembrane [Metarhizium rileyi]|uniref:Amino acid transporter, transmembrane n=1 Tax=Metarhizium rileyi (strain RCEF 4871) TaxID=1649241 RepID=A0A167AWP2_METRR|nr:Amino acid transporter, transmembrane [Metarhizium rileyi RCEF 4871]